MSAEQHVLTPEVTEEPLAFANRNGVVGTSAELHGGDLATGWSLIVTGVFMHNWKRPEGINQSTKSFKST